MRRALIIGLAVAVLCWAPLWPDGYNRLSRSYGVLLDAVAMLVLLWGLCWVGPRRSGRLGSWRARLLAVPWSLWMSFGLMVGVSRMTTEVVLPLYDAVLLSRHLYILGRDLYGVLATVGLLAVCGLPLAFWALGAALMGVLERAAWQVGPRSALVGLIGVLTLGGIGWSLPESTVYTSRLEKNIDKSMRDYERFQDKVEARRRRAPVRGPLTVRPDAHIYIVESYGSVLAKPPYRERWLGGVEAMAGRMEEAGWHIATGRSWAPVHGGRSWIADASLLTGLKVAHQSTFQHLISQIDGLQHLPSFLESQGYNTVLVRPKDKARPGVKLVNHFDFQHTVFADDLGYEGPIVGWGVIPDQYTLEWVYDNVLDGLEGPTFAFFHLVTAHIPWSEAPPLLDDYRDWQTHPPLAEDAEDDERSLSSQLSLEFRRWRHRAESKKKADEGQGKRYLDAVLYDLGAIERVLAGGPERPAVMLIMGDHQPPRVAEGQGFDVPVHVLASDPALLTPWVEAGFTPGMSLTLQGERIKHQEIFKLLATSLATAD